MIVVYKYELGVKTDINMPLFAEVLSVGCQTGCVFLWAKVNTELQPHKRTFVVYGTGHEIDDTQYDYHFIGTVPMDNSKLIWHIFEQLPKQN